MRTKEEIYSRIRKKVSEIYEKGETIKIENLLDWVNSNCKDLMDTPYRGLRSVLGAAWRRGSDSEKEALEYAVVNKEGKSPLKG